MDLILLIDCSLSFHRQCVRTVDDVCPGPNLSAKKDRANDRLSKFMERIRPERKPPSSHHHHAIATNHVILGKFFIFLCSFFSCY